MLFQILGELVVDHAFGDRFHFGIAELALGLSFKLWLANANRDNGRQSLANVICRQVLVFSLRICSLRA